MFCLETQAGLRAVVAPTEFINAEGVAVTLLDYALGAADRMALGIWSLESDEPPDPTQAVTTDSTFEKRENVYVRHWTTRPLTADEQADVAAVKTEALQFEYVSAAQSMMDARAQERNYDNVMSACTYAGSSVVKFNAEGTALKNWRDQVWIFTYQQLALVQSGQMPMPTVDAFIASLPQFTWPT